MATAASLTPKSLPAATAHFDQVLSEFKAELSQHEVDDFSYTTAADLKEAIHQLQEEQASKKRMQNLRRLNAFVEAMDQYDKVIQVFLNATQYLGFIWGPAKFMLLVASSHGDALNTLLEAYQEIGEHMPLLEQYESLMVNNPYLQQVVGFIYKDILDFHRKAMKHFRQRGLPHGIQVQDDALTDNKRGNSSSMQRGRPFELTSAPSSPACSPTGNCSTARPYW